MQQLGHQVAIYGRTALVSAYDIRQLRGVVLLLQRDETGQWHVQRQLQAPQTTSRSFGNRFGHTLAISENLAFIGAYGAEEARGAVYVYGRHVGGQEQWGVVTRLQPQGGLKADDHFGTAVGLDPLPLPDPKRS